MRVDVVMPKMGESVQEGKIIRWVKRVGERVEQDETLLEISTDKVDTEIPAPASGVLAEILAPEGETVPVGTVIARIEVEVCRRRELHRLRSRRRLRKQCRLPQLNLQRLRFKLQLQYPHQLRLRWLLRSYSTL
jgi:hypothetical protein